MPSTTVAVGETACIWLKFNTDTQLGPIENARLQGLHLNMAAHGGSGSAIAWYMEDDTNGVLGRRRWDSYGPPPWWPEYTKFNQVLVAVNGMGIRNQATDDYIMLYAGSSRVALLGAVKLDTPATYTFALGTLGINFNSAPTAPPVEFGTLTVVPEPAVAALAALGALLRRR